MDVSTNRGWIGLLAVVVVSAALLGGLALVDRLFPETSGVECPSSCNEVAEKGRLRAFNQLAGEELNGPAWLQSLGEQVASKKQEAKRTAYARSRPIYTPRDLPTEKETDLLAELNRALATKTQCLREPSSSPGQSFLLCNPERVQFGLAPEEALLDSERKMQTTGVRPVAVRGDGFLLFGKPGRVIDGELEIVARVPRKSSWSSHSKAEPSRGGYGILFRSAGDTKQNMTRAYGIQHDIGSLFRVIAKIMPQDTTIGRPVYMPPFSLEREHIPTLQEVQKNGVGFDLMRYVVTFDRWHVRVQGQLLGKNGPGPLVLMNDVIDLTYTDSGFVGLRVWLDSEVIISKFEYSPIKKEEPLANDDIAQTWIVSVGVGKHQFYSGISTELPCAADGAIRFAEELGRSLKIPKDHRLVITNANATKANVVGSIEKFLAQASYEDTVLFYFGGHIGAESRASQDAMGYPVEQYMLVYDTVASAVSDSAISLAEVLSSLRLLSAEKIVVVLDGCHSAPQVFDTEGWAPMRTDAMRAWLLQDSRLIVLTASTGNEVALELARSEKRCEEGDGGVYTNALISSLDDMKTTLAKNDCFPVRQWHLTARQHLFGRYGEIQHPTITYGTNGAFGLELCKDTEVP